MSCLISVLLSNLITSHGMLSHGITFCLWVANQPAGKAAVQSAASSASQLPAKENSRIIQNRIQNQMSTLTRQQIEERIATGAKVSLNGQNLQGLDLSGLNLSGFDFSYANLNDVNFRLANLSEAILWSVQAGRANFSQANLSGANLGTANLSEANLQGAMLRRASLLGTSLNQANLSGADLSGADLQNAILEGVIHNTKTQWPEGFQP